jgi:hypothetical protein
LNAKTQLQNNDHQAMNHYRFFLGKSIVAIPTYNPHHRHPPIIKTFFPNLPDNKGCLFLKLALQESQDDSKSISLGVLWSIGLFGQVYCLRPV